MANYAKLIAINLKKLFKDKGLTQTELAKKSGLKQPVISRALNGEMDNPKILTLAALADPFGKSAEWLITDHSKINISADQALEILQEKIKNPSTFDLDKSITKTVALSKKSAQDASKGLAKSHTVISGGTEVYLRKVTDFLSTANNIELEYLAERVDFLTLRRSDRTNSGSTESA